MQKQGFRRDETVTLCSPNVAGAALRLVAASARLALP